MSCISLSIASMSQTETNLVSVLALTVVVVAEETTESSKNPSASNAPKKSEPVLKILIKKSNYPVWP